MATKKSRREGSREKGRRETRKSRAARWARSASFAVAGLVATALGLLGWLLMVYPDRAAHGADGSFVVEIPTGVSARQAVARLAEEGVVREPRVFEMYLRILGKDHALRHGRLLMAGNLTPYEVMRRLTRGALVPVRVVVPEGWNRFEIAARLEARGVCDAGAFLDATAVAPSGVDAPSLEGYLFPDSYDFNEGTAPSEIVARLRENWERRVGALLEEQSAQVLRLRDELGFDVHDIVTLASVVEEEAAVPEERATVAGVFLNRLRSQTFRPLHRLQADPTVTYGCVAEPSSAPSCAGFAGTITRPMLEDGANRYNTYRHGGLPPGPITNPGLDAVRAVLSPERHDYLYFVARGGRRHAFSAELSDHNKAVDRLREP